jgi:hypothetical protein
MMSGADEQGPRLAGDAAWKAHRDEIERRNAAVKKTARDENAVDQRRAAGRAQRLEQSEDLALERLNERIDRERS